MKMSNNDHKYSIQDYITTFDHVKGRPDLHDRIIRKIRKEADSKGENNERLHSRNLYKKPAKRSQVEN